MFAPKKWFKLGTAIVHKNWIKLIQVYKTLGSYVLLASFF